MPSAAAEIVAAPAADALAAATRRWDFEPSRLGDHGRACCRDARGWFRMLDRSAAGDRAAPVTPAWMNHRWKWGPSRWPLHWWEAVRLEKVDCGALAAFAHESLSQRGVPHATVQIIQLYTEEACAHWTSVWDEEADNTRWIEAPLVYHEAVALVRPSTGEVQMWDPSRGRWMDDPEAVSYGATIAVRVWPHGEELPALRIGGTEMTAGRWTPVPL